VARFRFAGGAWDYGEGFVEYPPQLDNGKRMGEAAVAGRHRDLRLREIQMGARIRDHAVRAAREIRSPAGPDDGVDGNSGAGLIQGAQEMGGGALAPPEIGLPTA
jgi:hypothetical protein